jgi:hypothetical protein
VPPVSKGLPVLWAPRAPKGLLDKTALRVPKDLLALLELKVLPVRWVLPVLKVRSGHKGPQARTAPE